MEERGLSEFLSPFLVSYHAVCESSCSSISVTPIGSICIHALFGLCGIFQLFTPYHHRRILAPAELPLYCALLFQNCQPQIARLYKTPCAKGIMTYRQRR